MEIKDIKTNLSIQTVLNHYQIPVKNNHCKCPFHADDKPSLKFYPETNTYNCFGCGKTGDVIQFIQDKGTAFDPYRQKDFERRKAEGFSKPLYPSTIPTPEATPEQQKERERIGGW